MKYQQSNNEEQLKNILSFRNVDYITSTALLWNCYMDTQDIDMSFLEEANIHWQEDVIQNINVVVYPKIPI